MSYLAIEVQSMYSTASANWATRWGGVLPFISDVISVFCSPSERGNSLWVGSYTSVDVQSVYSTAPTDWEKRNNIKSNKNKQKNNKIKIKVNLLRLNFIISRQKSVTFTCKFVFFRHFWPPPGIHTWWLFASYDTLASVGRLLGLCLFQDDWVYCLVLEAPRKGNVDGVKHFCTGCAWVSIRARLPP